MLSASLSLHTNHCGDEPHRGTAVSFLYKPQNAGFLTASVPAIYKTHMHISMRNIFISQLSGADQTASSSEMLSSLLHLTDFAVFISVLRLSDAGDGEK